MSRLRDETPAICALSAGMPWVPRASSPPSRLLLRDIGARVERRSDRRAARHETTEGGPSMTSPNQRSNGSLNSRRWHALRAERDDLPLGELDNNDNDLFRPIGRHGGRPTADETSQRLGRSGGVSRRLRSKRREPADDERGGPPP